MNTPFTRRRFVALSALGVAHHRNLAKGVERRLKLKAIRVIGDPDLRVSRAAMLYGTPPFHASTVLSKVDVVIVGEQREWEGIEYLADSNTGGEPKGMSDPFWRPRVAV